MSIFLRNTYEYRLNKILNIILLHRSEINNVMREKYIFSFIGKGEQLYESDKIAAYSSVQITPAIEEDLKLIDIDIIVDKAFYFEITLIEPKWSLFIGTILIRVIRPDPKKFIKEYKQNCYYYNNKIIFNVDKIYDFFIKVHFCNL